VPRAGSRKRSNYPCVAGNGSAKGSRIMKLQLPLVLSGVLVTGIATAAPAHADGDIPSTDAHCSWDVS
jgi:hypothetical protein